MALVLIAVTDSCYAGEVEEKFERIANEFEFFCTHEFLYDRLEFRHVPKDKAQKYIQLVKDLLSTETELQSLCNLLKHKFPKVRTLALAALFAKEDPKLLIHIASMMDDSAETFPYLKAQSVALVERDGKLEPTGTPYRMKKQTVGQVAQRMIEFYLTRAGFGWTKNPQNLRPSDKKRYEAYWAKRKDRSYCASWFAVQLARAGHGIYPTPKKCLERVKAVRERIDELPEDDGAWTLLWLNYPYTNASDVLATEEELIDACKKLGPEKLLLMLQQKILSDDPDLQPRDRQPYKWMCVFVLKHADKLLRAQDAQILLDSCASGPNCIRTPWWAIAAAHLQPDKAQIILHEAFKRFQGEYKGEERADIATALWKLVGKSQTKFLISWYYTEPLQRGRHPQCRTRLLRAISKIPDSQPRSLVALIIQDKRFEDLDWQCFKELVLIVNGWYG